MKNNIKKYRALRGITQKDLAESIRVSTNTISNIENQRTKHIKCHTAKKICDFFNVSFKQMFEDGGNDD